MGSLGDFSSAVKEASGETDEFTTNGQTFVAAFTAPPILYLQIGAAATGKLEETEALGAVWQLFDTCLGPDEFARFYKHAVANSLDLDTLIALSMAIFQAQAGRPTVEPAGSSPGLLTTSPTSSSTFSPSPASGPVLPPIALSVAPPVMGDTRPDEILSTPERIARMVPVERLLTG